MDALEPAAGAAVTTTRPAVARVNLLPPEVLQGRRLRRLKGALVAAVACSLAASAAGFAVAARAVSEQEELLAAAQATTLQLQAAQGQYAEVPAVLAQVQAAEDARSRALGRDVAWHALLDDIARATPEDVWLTGMTVAVADPAAAATGTTGTPATSGVATISFTARGRRHPDVAGWLDAMAAVPGLADPTFAAATDAEVEGTTVVDFSGTATVTADRLVGAQQ